MKILFFTVAFALAAVACLQAETDLRVHLLRDVVAMNDPVTVGNIAVIAAPDDLLKTVSAIPVGRSPWPGEELVLVRKVLLARLAVSGFDVDRITLTGAREVRISAPERNIPPRDILRVAEDLLQRLPNADPNVSWRPITRIDPVAAAQTSAPLDLSAQLLSDPAAYNLVVEVTGRSDDDVVFRRTVTFQPVRRTAYLLASRRIRAGETIDETNVRVDSVEHPDSPTRLDPDVETFLGARARLSIRAGARLRPNMIAPPSDEPVVGRNELVRMVIHCRGLTVTAIGQALAPARVGEIVKIRNVDSQRIIVATVTAPGIVEPLFAP